MNRILLLIAVSVCLAAGCRKPKPAPPAPEPAPEPAAPATKSQTPGGTPRPAAVNIPLLETSVEFSDLNGLVGGYYEKHKRLPTVPELTKMYYKPIPIPEGYKLVIDPQSKQVKLVR